jgi:CheY-like chemotaxis protein
VAEARRADVSEPDVRPEVEPEPEGPTELAATVRGVVETMAKLAAERAVRVDVSIADTLSPIALSRTVLRQALFNVLGYVVAVSPGAHLRLTAAETHRGLDLWIDARRRPGRPRRPSLDAADETLAAEAQLTAGRKLLQAHGTALELRHQPDGALGIVLALPAASERQVLVVDDNPDIVSVFRRYLRGAGYRLIHASTAAGAVRLAADLRPDVVILDLMMPAQDGWEILTQLRALPATEHTPVVVCSVLPEQSLASSLGVAAFLAKPVNRRALLSALEQLAPAPAPAGRPG